MKLIRELRMGAPKTFKTGAIVGSYPKPMLYFGFDVDGISVVPYKNIPTSDNQMKFDVCYEEIVFCQPGKLNEWVGLKEQPKILAVDYTKVKPVTLTLDYTPLKAQEGLRLFQDKDIGDFNRLANKTELPWKTVVFDGVTGYMETVLSHFSSMNPNRMADARDWAFQVGQMVKRVITSLTTLPCHIVVLMHSEMEKDELSQQIHVIPSVYGKELKNIASGLFSQYFYADKENGKAVVYTNDKNFVKGIGNRWPQGLPTVNPPDFKSIYGKELI